MAGDPTARLVVNLDGNAGDKAGAVSAELEALRTTMRGDEEAIGQLRKALANLKGTTGTNADAAADLKKQLMTKREALAANQMKALQLGGTLDQLFVKQTKEVAVTVKAATGLKALGAELRNASPAAANLWSKVSMLGAGWLGAAAAAVALTVAVAGLTAGLATAAVGLVTFGLAAADAARNERLMLEGLVRARGNLSGSENIAAGFQEAVRRVAADVPLATAEVEGMAKSLWTMRLRGDALEKTLRGMALAKSVGQDFYALGMNAGMAGQNFTNLAKEAERRFGPVVAKQMFSLSVQSAKLKDQLKDLFRGVEIAPLGAAFKSITDMFRESSVLGWELRRSFENLFNPLIGDAAQAGPLLQTVLTKLAIKVFEVANATMRAAIIVKRWLSEHDITKTREWTSVLDLAGVALVVIGGMALAAAGGFVVLLAAAAAVASPFVALGAAIRGVRTELAKGKDWGTALVMGIGEGISSGAHFVWTALKALVTGIKEAFKLSLKIASPSKVFFEYGANISEGTAEGIKSKADAPRLAAAAMVPEPRAATAVAGGGRSGPIVGTMQVYLASDTPAMRDQADELLSMLAGVAERIAVQVGAPLGAT